MVWSWAALENHRVDVADIAGYLRAAAQRAIEFLQALVEDAGFFEIEILAGLFTFFFSASRRELPPVSKNLRASELRAVLFFRAAGETRREAHLHFGIEAAGEVGSRRILIWQRRTLKKSRTPSANARPLCVF